MSVGAGIGAVTGTLMGGVVAWWAGELVYPWLVAWVCAAAWVATGLALCARSRS